MLRDLASDETDMAPAAEASADVSCTFLNPAGAGAAAPFQLSRAEKRSAPRRRVLLSAIVVSREFDAVVRCQVRDVSENGARLVIPASFIVPAGFWLIAVSSCLAYEATLVWRKYPNAGVSLGEPVDLDEPMTRIGRRLRAIWMAAA